MTWRWAFEIGGEDAAAAVFASTWPTAPTASHAAQNQRPAEPAGSAHSGIDGHDYIVCLQGLHEPQSPVIDLLRGEQQRQSCLRHHADVEAIASAEHVHRDQLSAGHVGP